jgi:hypothetical protein
MGTKKSLIVVCLFVLFVGYNNLCAQDYIQEKPIRDLKVQDEYSFKKGITVFAGSSFSLINYFRSLGAFTNYSVSPPPLSLLVAYRPVHWFSIDAGVTYENYKMLYSIAGTSNFEKGLVRRLNIGLRPVLYAKIDEGNFILMGFRIGMVNGSGLKKLSQEFSASTLGGPFKESGATFQLFIGQQYKFARNSSIQYELAIGSPYYFALGYVHHFNLGE